jgi:hypothetical protein
VKESLLTLKDKSAYDFVCRVLSAILLLGNIIPYENEKEGIFGLTKIAARFRMKRYCCTSVTC